MQVGVDKVAVIDTDESISSLFDLKENTEIDGIPWKIEQAEQVQ